MTTNTPCSDFSIKPVDHNVRSVPFRIICIHFGPLLAVREYLKISKNISVAKISSLVAPGFITIFFYFKRFVFFFFTCALARTTANFNLDEDVNDSIGSDLCVGGFWRRNYT